MDINTLINVIMPHVSKESTPRGGGIGLPLKGVSIPCPLRGQGYCPTDLHRFNQ